MIFHSISYHRFMIDNSIYGYGVNLQLVVCLESSAQCDRVIQVLDKTVLPKTTCAFTNTFEQDSMWNLFCYYVMVYVLRLVPNVTFFYIDCWHHKLFTFSRLKLIAAGIRSFRDWGRGENDFKRKSLIHFTDMTDSFLN